MQNIVFFIQLNDKIYTRMEVSDKLFMHSFLILIRIIGIFLTQQEIRGTSPK